MRSKNLYRLIKIAFTMTIAFLLMMPMGMRVFADEPTSDTKEGDDDVGMSVVKEVNVQEDGTYIIDLEAFATGKVDFSEKTVPVDLILVLDVSGSMADDIHTYRYDARTSRGYSYNGYGNNSQYYYKHSDGNYYRVQRDRQYVYWPVYDWTYDLHYTVGGTTYYLSGTGTTTTRPTNVTNNNSTIWTGVLYTRTEVSSESKISALHTAVNGFIDVVAEKNQEVIDHNAETGVETTDAELSRVALVKFAGNSRNGTGYANYPNNKIGRAHV